ELMRLGSARPDVSALQAMVLYNNTPLPVLRLPNVVFTPSFELDNGTARFDLLLDVADSPEGFLGHLKYRSDLFKRETIVRLMEEWRGFIERSVANPDQPMALLRPCAPRAKRVSPAPTTATQLGVNGEPKPEGRLRQSQPDHAQVNGRAPLLGPRDDLEAKLVPIWEAVFE